MSPYLLPVLVPSPGAPPTPPAPPAPSCASCPYAKPLHFTVYCSLDEHVRNLPDSFARFPPFLPYVQHTAPHWCPLRTV